MDTCTNTVQRPDTSCTYCAALGGNVQTFSKRVGPRAKNSKYPMLTRDTCRSVDFTAWRVCPHTHVYIYTHIHIRSFSKDERNLVFIRARGTSTGSGSSTNARGRSGSGRGRVLHACVHVGSRDVSRFRASLYIRAFIYGYIRPGGWLRDCIGWR